MATSLGSLVVSLGLNAAEFTTGLTKSEAEARKFAKAIDKGIKDAATEARDALTAMGVAALAAFVAVDQLIKQAANFKDLEEKTGANAEALAGFAVAAAVAGTSMDTVAQASIKLTKNLTGVDDESKAAGAALKALGLTLKDFKALDPAAQMEALAKAFAGFADGPAKTAVAIALIGKNGAELLPFLKELEASGGRQVILTQAQIKAADDYSDAQARAREQLLLYAQAAAIQAIPAITALTKATTDLIKELVGMNKTVSGLASDDLIGTFAGKAVTSIGFVISVVQGAARVFEGLALTIETGAAQIDRVAHADFAGAAAIGRKWKDEIKHLLEDPLFSTTLAKRLQEARDAQKFPGEENPRSRGPRDLVFNGPKTGGGGTSDRVSEAQRYLDMLQKQLDKTQELDAVTLALAEIQSGKLKGLTPQLQSDILFLAQRVDQEKELKKEIADRAKAEEEAARAAAQAARERQSFVDSAFREAEATRQGNDALEEEIAVILGGIEVKKAQERAHINSAIAKKQDALATELLTHGEGDAAQFIRAEIALLEKRNVLLTNKDVALQIKADADAMQQFKDVMSDSFANAFEDFIMGTKSASQAFKDLANDIEKYLLKIALHKLGDQLFGGQTSGSGDLFGAFFKSLMGLFGGGSGLQSAAGGFQGFGMFARGTPYAPGGMAMVGEHGPELVQMPRGARVWPTGTGPQAANDSVLHVENHFHVQGTINTGTVRQVERAVGDSVARTRIDR